MADLVFVNQVCITVISIILHHTFLERIPQSSGMINLGLLGYAMQYLEAFASVAQSTSAPGFLKNRQDCDYANSERRIYKIIHQDTRANLPGETQMR